MLLVPIALGGLLGFLFIAQPHYSGGMDHDPTPAWITWVPLVGILLFAIGLAWMIRIYRGTFDAEARRSSWRSRSR
jgi:hypothetical protein